MSRLVLLLSTLPLNVFRALSLITNTPFAQSLELSPSTKEVGATDASFPTDDAIALMNHRLAQLELENRKLRDRLGVAEETHVQQRTGEEDSDMAEIFIKLATELAELGPDLLFELVTLLLIGGLVLLVTKGLSPPSFIASKLADNEAGEDCKPVTSDTSVTNSSYPILLLLQLRAGMNATCAIPPLSPGAIQTRTLQCCEAVEAPKAPETPAAAEATDTAEAPRADEALVEVEPRAVEEANAAEDASTAPKEAEAPMAVPPEDVEDCGTGRDELELERPQTPDPGPPPGLELMSPTTLKQDALDQQFDDPATDEKQKFPQEDDEEEKQDQAENDQEEEEEPDVREPHAAEVVVDQPEKIHEEGEGAVVEHALAASGSEPESEPKVSRNSPSVEVKADAAVATKRARKTGSKKSRQIPKVPTPAGPGDANFLDDVDEFSLPLSGKLSEGLTRRRDHLQSKKRGRHQQQRSDAPKRSAEDANSRRQAWGCHWPCSWQLTLALAVMLGVTLVGKVADVSGRSPRVKEQIKVHESIEHLKAKRNQMARQLALLKLEQIQREALATAQSLPAEADKSSLLGASSDAKNLLGALKDVEDADFPTVEKDVEQMMGHWKTKIAAAKVRAEAGGEAKCAASKE